MTLNSVHWLKIKWNQKFLFWIDLFFLSLFSFLKRIYSFQHHFNTLFSSAYFGWDDHHKFYTDIYELSVFRISVYENLDENYQWELIVEFIRLKKQKADHNLEMNERNYEINLNLKD